MPSSAIKGGTPAEDTAAAVLSNARNSHGVIVSATQGTYFAAMTEASDRQALEPLLIQSHIISHADADVVQYCSLCITGALAYTMAANALVAFATHATMSILASWMFFVVQCCCFGSSRESAVPLPLHMAFTIYVLACWFSAYTVSLDWQLYVLVHFSCVVT